MQNLKVEGIWAIVIWKKLLIFANRYDLLHNSLKH